MSFIPRLRTAHRCVRLQHPGISPSFRLHVRPISYSVPRSTARALRVPIVVIIICAGGLGYAEYKFKQLRKKAFAWISGVQDSVTGVVNSAANGLKSMKPPKDLHEKTNGLLSTAQNAATGVVNSASNSLKSVKSPDIKTPQFLKDLFSPVDSTDASSQDSKRGKE